jgi:hypothetical protein
MRGRMVVRYSHPNWREEIVGIELALCKILTYFAVICLLALSACLLVPSLISNWNTTLRLSLWIASGAVMGTGLFLPIKRPFYGTFLGAIAAAVILGTISLVARLF